MTDLIANVSKHTAVCAVIGAISGGVSSFFGGYTVPLQMLMGLVVLDFITGFVVAAAFKKSPKTEGGALSSYQGWLGLMRGS